MQGTDPFSLALELKKLLARVDYSSLCAEGSSLSELIWLREIVTGVDQKVESVLHQEAKRQSTHKRKSWTAPGTWGGQGMGLAGRGWLCYVHTSGRGFTAFLAEGTLPCLRYTYQVREIYWASALLSDHLSVRSFTGRFDISVGFIFQRTSFPP